MAGSTFGSVLKCTTWGESHGEALGVVIDGFPAGIPVSVEDIQVYLNRRKPGQNPYTTPRTEGDQVEILSGIFNGLSTGTSISMLVRNTSQRSSDYDELSHVYRPGHADYCFDAKYGFRDYRGGGRSSGRETIGRVAAGALALQLLHALNIEVHAMTRSIGPVTVDSCIDWETALTTPTAMPDLKASKQAEEYLKNCIASHDSSGGVIECFATGIPVGIGEPVFYKLDACLAQAVMSIGAVKAVEIGDGINAASTVGSVNNDAFCIQNEKVVTKTNHCGGILGGISNGQELRFRAYVKPTPSIFSKQQTITDKQEETTIQIAGRHDPVIVPRAVVVVECMTAFTIADLLLLNMTNSLDKIKKVYFD